MIYFDSGDTPEEFWYNKLAKYHDTSEASESEAVHGFPQDLIVTSLMKMAHRDVAVYKGYLDSGDSLIITYPTSNHAVRNFIGIGIADCDYTEDTSVQVYELDYNQPMTDEFVFDLLVKSHGWTIKDYGDLSGY